MNRFEAIISVQSLAQKLAAGTKNFRLLDGSWHLPNTNRNPKAEFEKEHIPSAQFFDIDGCAMKDTDLNHMLPKQKDFETYAGKLGINNNTEIVVYDNSDTYPLFSAQRVWWTFRCFGHDKISVMEGGLQKWKKLKNPVTSKVDQVPTETFKASFREHLVKSFEQVEANLKNKQFMLLDARPAERFAGIAPEPRPDIKPGCIPESTNLPFTAVMNVEQGTFKTKEQLEELFESLCIHLSKPIVACCGSGISACNLALAGYICGKDDVAVYDGAWVEWFQRAKPDQMRNVPHDDLPAS